MRSDESVGPRVKTYSCVIPVKLVELDELSSGAPHKIWGVLYEIGGKHGVQPSAKAARSGGNVGGTQPSPIQLDCLRAARRRGADEPDWGAYWTRLAEHQEAAGQLISPRQWRGARPRTRLCPGTTPRTRPRAAGPRGAAAA